MNIFKKNYRIGGINIEINSELPITDKTFHPKFAAYETTTSSTDKMLIELRFDWEEDITVTSEDDPFYINATWKIIRKNNRIIYKWINPLPPHDYILRKAISDNEHTHVIVFNNDFLKNRYLQGNLLSLSMFPTDQILIGAHLAHRQGCILHSLGIILDKFGFIFIGHSDAGKSTIANIMKKHAEILCDDRNIVRKTLFGYQLYGTWSHGDVTDISPNSCPLRAIFFIEKSIENSISPLTDSFAVATKLIACLIRPISTSEWWNKSLDLITDLSKTIPSYNLKFNKNPDIINIIKQTVNHEITNEA